MDRPEIPKDDDWRHYFYALDEFGAVDESWSDFVRLWNSKRHGNRLPAWSDFDMFDFKPWLGFIAVHQIMRNPFDTWTRLWGTQLTELYGEDRTGMTLSRSQVDWCVTLKDWEFWTRVAKEPCIGRSEGNIYWKARDHIYLSRIFLPFGEDGKTCDIIVSATRRIDI